MVHRSIFKREGLSIDSAAADAFIDKTGFETRQIMNEAEKMVLFKGDDKTITIYSGRNENLIAKTSVGIYLFIFLLAKLKIKL